MEPIDDLLGSAEYKIYIAGVLLERALAQALRTSIKNRMEEWLNQPIMQILPVRINVNGENWQGAIPAHETLLEFIRVRLGLTGTKRSCESQVCGACTVLVDEQPISSCNYLAFEANGKSVLTIEGLSRNDSPRPLTGSVHAQYRRPVRFLHPGSDHVRESVVVGQSIADQATNH